MPTNGASTDRSIRDVDGEPVHGRPASRKGEAARDAALHRVLAGAKRSAISPASFFLPIELIPMRAHPAACFVLSLSLTANALLAQTTYVVAKGTAFPEILSALQVAVAGDIIEVDEIDPATPGQAARYLPFLVD